MLFFTIKTKNKKKKKEIKNQKKKKQIKKVLSH